MIERGSKEYYKKQSEFWFNETSKFLKQRDMLISDIDSYAKSVMI
ncbi:hypothetical protein [Staphylococcus felis]|nr:hypothetical protein [Staphylococcus felis]